MVMGTLPPAQIAYGVPSRYQEHQPEEATQVDIERVIQCALGAPTYGQFAVELDAGLMRLRLSPDRRARIKALGRNLYTLSRPVPADGPHDQHETTGGPGTSIEDYSGPALKGTARGGKYHARVTIGGKHRYLSQDDLIEGKEAERAYIEKRLRRVLDKTDDPTAFESLCNRYGTGRVAKILHGFGARVKEGRVVLAEEATKAEIGLRVSDRDAGFLDGITAGLTKGRKVAPGGAGGVGGGSAGSPPGTIQVWNTRVMEKDNEGNWHVIGHVAGLEGERVPRGTREHLAEVLKKRPGALKQMSGDTASRIIATLKQTGDTGQEKHQDKSPEEPTPEKEEPTAQEVTRAKKGDGPTRTHFQGIPVNIEAPRGTARHGTLLTCGYGFIPGYRGADGDDVDVLVGNDDEAPTAYAVSVESEHLCRKAVLLDPATNGVTGHTELRTNTLVRPAGSSKFDGFVQTPLCLEAPTVKRECRPTALLEGVGDVCPGHPETTRYVLKTEALISQLSSLGDVKRAGALRELVKSDVVGPGDYLQVRDGVVEPVAVLVVDDLGSLQRSANVLLHDDPVLKALPLPVVDQPVLCVSFEKSLVRHSGPYHDLGTVDKILLGFADASEAMQHYLHYRGAPAALSIMPIPVAELRERLASPLRGDGTIKAARSDTKEYFDERNKKPNQRAHRRNWNKRNRDVMREIAATQRKTNPTHVAARHKVEAAGGAKGTCQAEGCTKPATKVHHTSYDPPREVHLCAEHHEQRHATRKSKADGKSGFSPPEGARSAARRGLEARKKWNRGGLSSGEAGKQGIGSGVQRASDLASGDALSEETIRMMNRFFGRHQKNYAPGKKESDGGPTAGTIAWWLWGGDAGKSWAAKMVERFDRDKTKKSDQLPGGVGDKLSPADVDKDDLEIGIEVELEHTTDRAIATEIALDHAAETAEALGVSPAEGLRRYYADLAEMESAYEEEVSKGTPPPDMPVRQPGVSEVPPTESQLAPSFPLDKAVVEEPRIADSQAPVDANGYPHDPSLDDDPPLLFDTERKAEPPPEMRPEENVTPETAPEPLAKPGFVKTPEDEKRWAAAKEAAKDDSASGGVNYALATHIFHQKKAE